MGFASQNDALSRSALEDKPLGTPRFFAIFEYGKVIAICKGAAAARLLSPCRAYKSFATELAAQEWAAWFNYTKE